MRKVIALLATGLLLIGTHVSAMAAAKSPAPLPASPDYSHASGWVVKTRPASKPVDVFFVYPTIYMEAFPKNMDVSRPDLQAAARHLMVSQAGVYSGSANLFAPYYRQVSLAELDPNADMPQNRYFQIGASDIHRAFDYYLANINKGRPFILAGHSQGSFVLLELMRRRFFDPTLQQKLVAAYLIGYSVTADDLKRHPWLKIAQRADDTGVIITYNTQAPGATGSPVLSPGAVSVNPLSWTTGPAPADKSLNLGAVFFHEKSDGIQKEVRHYTGARVDLTTGALVTTPPDSFEQGHFPAGVYHKYDYSFWYRNLEENVARRIEAFLDR